MHRLESAHRHYIASIAEVILLCARQEFALRGHDESTKSHNRGNLRTCLQTFKISYWELWVVLPGIKSAKQ